ncbi:hypothetical protein D3C80_1049210 [compost metagenome]
MFTDSRLDNFPLLFGQLAGFFNNQDIDAVQGLNLLEVTRDTIVEILSACFQVNSCRPLKVVPVGQFHSLDSRFDQGLAALTDGVLELPGNDDLQLHLAAQEGQGSSKVVGLGGRPTAVDDLDAGRPEPNFSKLGVHLHQGIHTSPSSSVGFSAGGLTSA